MIKIAVCDDNSYDIEMTKNEVYNACSTHNIECEVNVYDNSETMVSDILRDCIEVVLLDIQMPQVSGLEIANDLKEAGAFINIIFLTNRADMVFESFRYHPFRFVRKEYIKEELGEALVAVEKKIASELHFVQFDNGKMTGSFKVRDIQYIESNGHYLVIHLPHTVCKVRGKISDCEKRLSALGFIRTQVGYLVNVRHVARLTSKEVQMDNGNILPVRRGSAEKIKIQYAKNMEKFVNGRYI